MSEEKNSIKTDSNIPVKKYYTLGDIKKENESDPGNISISEGYLPYHV